MFSVTLNWALGNEWGEVHSIQHPAHTYIDNDPFRWAWEKAPERVESMLLGAKDRYHVDDGHIVTAASLINEFDMDSDGSVHVMYGKTLFNLLTVNKTFHQVSRSFSHTHNNHY